MFSEELITRKTGSVKYRRNTHQFFFAEIPSVLKNSILLDFFTGTLLYVVGKFGGLIAAQKFNIIIYKYFMLVICLKRMVYCLFILFVNVTQNH